MVLIELEDVEGMVYWIKEQKFNRKHDGIRGGPLGWKSKCDCFGKVCGP